MKLVLVLGCASIALAILALADTGPPAEKPQQVVIQAEIVPLSVQVPPMIERSFVESRAQKTPVISLTLQVSPVKERRSASVEPSLDLLVHYVYKSTVTEGGVRLSTYLAA